MTNSVTPFSLKDAPALIERLLPVQKLSTEVYVERMSSHGQTLVSLGGYWKGRKPLILNKANDDTLCEAFGDEDEAWDGKTAELFVDKSITFAGKRVGGVRIRIPAERVRVPEERVSVPEEQEVPF